jgi:hypothetical protein
MVDVIDRARSIGELGGQGHERQSIPPNRTWSRCVCGSASFVHNDGVTTLPQDGLTDEQRAWALHSEALWARAHAIANAHPGIDAGDVYHALRCLELPLAERLRLGLSRGRLRAYAR